MSPIHISAYILPTILSVVPISGVIVRYYTRGGVIKTLAYITTCTPMTEREEQLSTLRKRRGVSKGSVTRLHARVAELESDLSNPDTRDSAKRLLEKLEGHDKEYRNRHMAIVDLTEDDQLDANLTLTMTS